MGTRRKLAIESQVVDTHEPIGKRKTAFQKHTILKWVLGKGLFPTFPFKSHCVLGHVGGHLDGTGSCQISRL